MSSIAIANSPIAKIFFNDNFVSSIYPKKVAEGIDQAEPFSYQIMPKIRLIDENIFDISQNVLQFDIYFSRPSQASILDAKREIKAFYDEPNRKVSDIILHPLEIATYEIWLKTPEFPDIEISLGNRNNGPYGSTPLQIRKHIVDEKIIDYITQNPEKVTIVFRPFYLFNVTDSSSVFMRFTDDACIRSFEKIFGRNPHSSYLVNRNALQFLREVYKSEIRIEFRNIDPNNKLYEKAVTEIFSFIDNLKPISPEELIAAQETMIIYGTDESKTEIQPIAYGNMVTSLENSQKLHKNIEKTWNKIESLAEDCSSTSNFYDEFKSHVVSEQNCHGKGTVDILSKIGISQSLNFDSFQDKSFSDLSKQEQTAFESFQENMKDSGSKKEEFLNESYKKWTGEDYEEGKTARPLSIFRISQSQLSKSLNATASIFEETGEEALVGPELQFPLKQDISMQNDISTYQERAFKQLKHQRPQLIQRACTKVWQRYHQDITKAVLAHSGNPTQESAKRKALMRFTKQFQTVLWGGIQQVMVSCRTGRRLTLPPRMPKIGYCESDWFRLAFIFIKNHHSLSQDEAAIADEYFDQIIAAWH